MLLLDEPLGALDLKLRTDMQTQLKDLQRSVGVTFCYVTHDQGEAFSMSDRVAVMNLGLLEQVGTPEDVYHRPASVFVADFVGTANRFPGRIESGDSGVYSVAIDGIGTRGVPGPAGLTDRLGGDRGGAAREPRSSATTRAPASSRFRPPWSTPRSSAPSAPCG